MNNLLSPVDINFGTDGWRAIVGKDFNEDSVRRAARAIACTFFDNLPEVLEIPGSSSSSGNQPLRIYVGFDTRAGADDFALIAAQSMARAAHSCEALARRNQKVQIVLSDRFVPTPTLCWTVARDKCAIGGIQLTASHNPAGWLGIKVRMADGGASPAEFTDKIEELLAGEVNVENNVTSNADLNLTDKQLCTADIFTAYKDALCQFVDSDAIRRAKLKLVVDPMYGAARGYLADIFEGLDATVVRLHDDCSPDFGGLHPEPIPPWTDGAAQLVRESRAQAGFALDGDADRLGALDEDGNFVSPHQIIALVAQHLVQNRGHSGRIIKTLSTSVLVDRVGRILETEVVTTPIGFKWIYAEMLAGDVLVGGEESGGIGVPSHVRERDGLLMSLLLAEMMAVTGQSLKSLVARLEAAVGKLYYQRRDEKLEQSHMRHFRACLPTLAPAVVAGADVQDYIYSDGAKFLLPDDEWLLLRASGTEPLVRIYAESASHVRTEQLIDAGYRLVQEAATT